ncbi:hypothetical protein N7481_004265 [Penicillium waksmanii]|uniref:uncharacterized protein n=1 Tax=Penicillium waksmanii TaxID=69791 RepID=UPI0025486788|nr:uncharacterized protein N7481_004265 [Penicillium waksmanii]KAJ5989055.1 hypothetical protein N7481_004265 [Penicillium waksmanii]
MAPILETVSSLLMRRQFAPDTPFTEKAIVLIIFAHSRDWQQPPTARLYRILSTSALSWTIPTQESRFYADPSASVIPTIPSLCRADDVTHASYKATCGHKMMNQCVSNRRISKRLGNPAIQSPASSLVRYPGALAPSDWTRSRGLDNLKLEGAAD